MHVRTIRAWGAVVALFLGLGACSSGEAEAPAGPPATVAQARDAIDLATFPLVAGAEKPRQRSMAALNYEASGDVKGVFEFQRRALVDRGWREGSDSTVSDQTSSGTFSRQGFRVSVGVYPGGKPGQVAVTIFSLGNVALDKLPIPKDAKPVYVGPAVAMYVTEGSPADTAAACRKMLLDAGWQPYGQNGDSLVFKQNAVRLNAMISAAPAQGGKTMISYSAELMSADLPAPAETIGLQYADSTKELRFDTKQSKDEVFKFYRELLARSGWEATLDHAIVLDNKDTVIFRNPAKDMLTLELFEFEGVRRVSLEHLSAAEVAEIEAAIKAAAEKKAAEKAAREAAKQ